MYKFWTTGPLIFSNQEIGCILRRHPHTKLKLIHALNGTKACSIGSWQLQAVQSTSVGLDTPYIHPKTDWLAPENWGLENYKYWIYGMESFKMLGHFWRPLYMIILIILIHLEYGTPSRPAFQNESWDLGALWLARVPLQKICLVSRKGILMIPVSGIQVRRHWPCTLMCLSCHRWISWAEKNSRSAWPETTQPNLTISKLHPNALARRGHDWCHP